MSVQSHFFRFVAFSATLLLLLVCVVRVSAQEIMPLSEVKPGMKGHGLAVFRGIERERFNFKVMGISLDDPNNSIVLLLSGGPKDEHRRRFVESVGVFSGMSGAPLFIDGKIIGALSSAWTYQKTPRAQAMPIEPMISMGRIALSGPNKFLKEEPPISKAPLKSIRKIQGGDIYVSCEVWNADGYCSGITGHVTLLDPGNPKIFYALGHEASTSNNNISIIAVPFWKGEVITLIPSFKSPDLLSNKTGPMLGSIIFNGPFGQIGKMEAIPKFFPVSIELEGQSYGPTRFNYFFAYTRNAGSNLNRITKNRSLLIDSSFDVEEETLIELENFGQIYYKSAIEKVIDLGSGHKTPVPAVGSVVKSLLTEEPDPIISRIRIILRAVPKYKILKLQEVTRSEQDEKGNFYFGLIAVNWKEWRTQVVFDEKYFNKSLSIMSGRQIAQKILSDTVRPNLEQLNLLTKVSDWNSAYLCYVPGETIVISELQDEDYKAQKIVQGREDSPRNWLKNGTWQSGDKPSIEILAQIKPPSSEYVFEGELNFLIESATQEEGRGEGKSKEK